MLSNPSFSIIIPHFNIPNLLMRCLDSIPIREDVQVIVVDDNSPDADTYLKRFSALSRPYLDFIQTSASGGAGYARNVGLKHVKGKYVLFADADDYFLPCFETILNNYQEETADIVFFNGISLDPETGISSFRANHLRKMHELYMKHPEEAKAQFRYLFGEPWCKFIRTSLIQNHHIAFDEVPIHNDTKFSYLVGYYAREIRVDPTELYCVTFRPNSVSRATSLDIEKVRTRVFAEKNRFLADRSISLFDPILLWPFQHFLSQKSLKGLTVCFRIAKSYGFSPLFILEKIYLPRIENRVKRRFNRA